MRATPLLLFFALAVSASAVDNRFTILDQSDFGAKTGIYLNFENSGTDPLRLGDLRLIAGLGDGKAWRFLVASGTFEAGKSYAIRLDADAKGGALTVDGREVARTREGGYTPIAVKAVGNAIPGFASAPVPYTTLLTNLSVNDGGPGPIPVSRPVDRLFSGPFPLSLGDTPFGPTVSVRATVRIEGAPDLLKLAPLVDRYGQYAYGEWAGKATTDEALRADRAKETATLAALAPPKTDPYGGRLDSPWSERATGFFRTTKHGEKWWLVSPLGHPLFYTGVCTAPAVAWDKTPVTGRESLFAELPPKDLAAKTPGAPETVWDDGPWGDKGTLYFAPHSPWLERLHGVGWREKTLSDAVRRLRALGFSGFGKWSDAGGKGPEFPVLWPQTDHPGLERLDPFDPKMRAQAEASLKALIAPRHKDPNVVGWSVGNERGEIVLNEEVAALMARPERFPGKVALLEYALKELYKGDRASFAKAYGGSPESVASAAVTVPASDVEPLRRRYATEYYRFLYTTIKAIDPDHLYLGFWIVPGWWQNEADWDLIAPYCDVIGYDKYADTFADPSLRAFFDRHDKPILCGEFSYPPTYAGARGFGVYGNVSVRDEADAAARYEAWIRDAAREPHCVGGLWFQYRDQPILGRGPDPERKLDATIGERYAFGIVDITDRLKMPMALRMRKANLGAFTLRNGN